MTTSRSMRHLVLGTLAVALVGCATYVGWSWYRSEEALRRAEVQADRAGHLETAEHGLYGFLTAIQSFAATDDPADRAAALGAAAEAREALLALDRGADPGTTMAADALRVFDALTASLLADPAASTSPTTLTTVSDLHRTLGEQEDTARSAAQLWNADHHDATLLGQELSVVIFVLAGAAAAALAVTVHRASLREARLATEAARQEREAAERSEQRFRALVQNGSDIIIVTDAGGAVRYTSPTVGPILGGDPHELEERSVLSLVHPDDAATAREGLERLVHLGEGGQEQRVLRLRHADGSWRYFEIHATNRLQDPGIRGIICNARDVTERMDAEARTTELAAVVEASSDIVILADRSGRISSLNRAAATALRATDATLGREFVQLLQPAEHERFITEILPALERFGRWSGDISLLPHNADEIPAEVELLFHRAPDGSPQYLSCVARDISERRRFESQVTYLANHDPVTGLLNRRRLEEELDRELARARGELQRRAVLLHVDLDGFKAVNEHVGHRNADTFLRSVGQAISEASPPGSVVARLGSDEFAVVAQLADGDDAGGIAERVRDAVRGLEADVGGLRVRVTASIGVALLPEHGRDCAAALVNADLALYEAKQVRDSWRYYTPGSARSFAPSSVRMWEQRIREAIETNSLVLYAQPIFAIGGEPTAVELLVRIAGSNGTLVPPAVFLPIAERSGLVHQLDRWVVQRGIELLTRLRAANSRLSVAVNISGRSLEDSELPTAIAGMIAQSHIDPSRLTLEITETAAIADIQEARRFLDPLHRLGVSLAIDDFGSGFSSFAYVKHLPVDHVKIDGSWIRNLVADPEDQHIVRAMIGLAHGLRKGVIAEYVEDRETADLLRLLGADQVQGYYFGRPVPLDELLATELAA